MKISKEVNFKHFLIGQKWMFVKLKWMSNKNDPYIAQQIIYNA